MNLPFQARLVEIIKQQVPQNISLPQELSQILNISSDSAYRRLRCETAFSLDETALVCKHFDVPLESLNDMISNVVSFKYNPVGFTLEDFRSFLQYFLVQIKGISQFEEKDVFYAAEDIPLFHLYGFRKLSDFKFFYWRKTILNHAELQNLKFDDSNHDEGLLDLAQKASLAYSEVPSTEIWTEETIASTLKQIKFYHEAGLFEKTSDALGVIDELKQLVSNLQRQCDLGLKIRPGGSVSNTPFTCYVSDLMIGNNCVLVHTNGRKNSFLGYNTFNFMSTGNPAFNRQNELWMNNLISKSTQISRTAEKIRNQFFKVLQKQIDDLKAFVEAS
jgi:hypothetical protein